MDSWQTRQILAAYRDAETYLIELVAELTRKRAYGTATFHWEQLQDLQRVMRAARRYLREIESGATPLVYGSIIDEYTTAYRAGAGEAPTAVPTRAAESLALETVEALSAAKYSVLRSVDDTFRRVMRAATSRALVSGSTNLRAAQQALDMFADRGIDAFRDSAGNRWSLDSYVDMALRTARSRAMNAGRIAGMQAAGIDLVMTSSHPGSSPQCAPYQGRVLALSGPAGPRTVYSPIERRDVTVDVYATMQEAIEAGYHHPNCRHVDTAFIPGMKPPVHPERDGEVYVAQQRQRQIERHIRRWKRRKAAALTPETEGRADSRIAYWQAEQRAHLDSHKILTRRYDREQVRRGVRGRSKRPWIGARGTSEN
ncbi:phage minor capsid protein [Corynebacterium sp. TAE3-ERU16]|uniref:phage minor capsid protein n=1 Tax=Corynebacterium sp. TAE3-ERU16 TaxID=2849493 RepID=UPI001C46A313|nr:phage minor capsid protein [Corynebacterium sp. TAE3-ERU16]